MIQDQDFQLTTPATTNREFNLPKKSKKELNLQDTLTLKLLFFI